MKYLPFGIITIIAIVLWTGFVTLGRINGFLLQAITDSDKPKAFIDAAQETVQEEGVGNMAIALVQSGKIEGEFYYSKGKPVDRNTLFQMASVSKWITAWGVLQLVEQNKLDLDKPISTYLTRWELPNSTFDHEKVTIRRILSHSAGLTDGLGYNGFEPNQAIQSIEASLTKATDKESYVPGETKVGIEPGTAFRYSGGGFTLLQLIIEETSGLTFQAYMAANVFAPLGMEQSTFQLSDTSKIDLAQSYTADGTLAPHYTYTALAAASLYTCIEDLTVFLQANGVDNPVLSKAMQDSMNMEYIIVNKYVSHGLGPFVYGTNNIGDYIIGHDGGNRPAINTSVRLNTRTNEGMIILSSGNPNVASKLGDEWVFWATGMSTYTVLTSNRRNILTWLILGNLLIVGLLIYVFWRRKKAT